MASLGPGMDRNSEEELIFSELPAIPEDLTMVVELRSHVRVHPHPHSSSLRTGRASAPILPSSRSSYLDPTSHNDDHMRRIRSEPGQSFPQGPSDSSSQLDQACHSAPLLTALLPSISEDELRLETTRPDRGHPDRYHAAAPIAVPSGLKSAAKNDTSDDGLVCSEAGLSDDLGTAPYRSIARPEEPLNFLDSVPTGRNLGSRFESEGADLIMYPESGSAPDALALRPAERRLFSSNSGSVSLDDSVHSGSKGEPDFHHDAGALVEVQGELAVESERGGHGQGPRRTSSLGAMSTDLTPSKPSPLDIGALNEITPDRQVISGLSGDHFARLQGLGPLLSPTLVHYRAILLITLEDAASATGHFHASPEGRQRGSRGQLFPPEAPGLDVLLMGTASLDALLLHLAQDHPTAEDPDLQAPYSAVRMGLGFTPGGPEVDSDSLAAYLLPIAYMVELTATALNFALKFTGVGDDRCNAFRGHGAFFAAVVATLCRGLDTYGLGKRESEGLRAMLGVDIDVEGATPGLVSPADIARLLRLKAPSRSVRAIGEAVLFTQPSLRYGPNYYLSNFLGFKVDDDGRTLGEELGRDVVAFVSQGLVRGMGCGLRCYELHPEELAGGFLYSTARHFSPEAAEMVGRMLSVHRQPSCFQDLPELLESLDRRGLISLGLIRRREAQHKQRESEQA